MNQDDLSDDDDFVTETVVWLQDDSKALERTIAAMENGAQLCVHPGHYHSFQQVSFLISLSKCAGCNQGLPALVFGSGSDTTKSVVRCVACGALAHRRCALSRDVHWTEPCPVNVAQISASSSSSSAEEDEDGSCVKVARSSSGTGSGSDLVVAKEATAPDTKTGSVEEIITTATAPSIVSNDTVDETSDADNVMVETDDMYATDSLQEDSNASTWTQEGPPQHWASNPQSLPTITFPAATVVSDGDADDSDDHVHVTPLHYANHPFASVSRALQDNVLAHFRRLQQRNNSDININNDDKSHSSPTKGAEPRSNSDVTHTDIVKALEARVEPKPVEASSEQENPIVKFASGTYEAVKTSVHMQRRLGAMAVAGGIAGGVAGLVIGGPVGAYAGAKLGQTAGALGVILEGSVSIGVFVASVATARYTAEQIQDQIDERRILTMGEDGITRKVLLVRPNIQIDPVWEQITNDARSSAPKAAPAFSLYPASDAAKQRERYRRDSDIVRTAEDEIPATEKVLLLVSRILNDKSSLPGHVYRFLIESFKMRCKERESILLLNPSIQAISPRARRDDAHAVIKHVTATLLEVRPGFASSPSFTELTATAVESLVFGQLYSLVFLEIASETRGYDTGLWEKIQVFEQERANKQVNNLVSETALNALRMLPESHSAVDKLYDTVRFLELISEHFSSATDGTVCADSLLKMACLHILATKVKNMNAQVAFLEEFARDEQLLRGREGYALVTLQASLHFLNMSTDIEKDIFGQDDDEENVPVAPETE